MVPEAPLERVENGVEPAGEGWFVRNVRDAPWWDTPLGLFADMDSEQAPFDQVGLIFRMLRPGEPSGMYHAEDAQEDFLVLSGECLLLVEGRERRLRAWDFVHCPPGTEHIFVGAGDGTCLVLGVGARRAEPQIRYVVDDVALKHGAGVETETTDPREAYARFLGAGSQVPLPPGFPEAPG
jgi:uncharacterized cupin superfamily protein